jgi:hypothetical protein
MDLNTMMREQALSGLRTQLDAAVTNGDTEAARKVTDQIATLTVQTAPKAPPYGDAEIRGQLEKAPWFGIDPKKSAKAVEFGKTMDPKKFATAELFAEALIKAVDAEFKPAGAAPAAGEEDDAGADDDAGTDGDGTEEEPPAAPKKPRKTDGPGDDNLRGATNRRGSGPWAKLSDAPADVQKEVKRQAEKFVSGNATKEQRDKFIAKALGSHYAQHQRNKRK